MGDHADDAVDQALDMMLDGEDPEDEHRAAAAKPICPYCGEPAVYTDGRHVYPHRPDLSNKRFWVCEPCDARVGSHPNGKPMGPLADSELRGLRMRAHKAFDQIWKTGRVPRNEAYEWLARELGIPENEAHIGRADRELCKRIIECCERRGDA